MSTNLKQAVRAIAVKDVASAEDPFLYQAVRSASDNAVDSFVHQAVSWSMDPAVYSTDSLNVDSVVHRAVFNAVFEALDL